MANISWLNPGTDDNWNAATAWSTGTVPTSADNITLGGANSNYTVTISSGVNAFANTLLLDDLINYTTLALAGGSLTTSGAITLNANYISGFGTINNGGIITNGAYFGTNPPGLVTASGGTLEITGAINNDVSLAISTASTSTLKLDGTVASARAISLTSTKQTLEVGPAGSLSINAAETATNGTIKLDGGTLTSGRVRTLTLTSPAQLDGFGTIAANWAVEGTGTVRASGGLLDVKGSVDSSTATVFQIDDSVAGSALEFEGVIGTTNIHPTVAFTTLSGSDYGKLDLSTESATNISQLGTISGFVGASDASIATSDAILAKGSGVSGDTVVWTQSGSTGALKVEDKSGATLETLTLGGTFSSSQFKVTENGSIDTITICFYPGTLIRTPDGEAAVETLKPGDLVLTSAGEAKPVNWLGRQTVSTVFADKQRVLPIRIKAGALGDNVPARDLLVSPDHAMLVDGVLIHAGALVNGTSIVRESAVPTVFTYYHVELDDHSLILAEGAPAETFVDNVDRMNFDNWSEFEALYPDGKTVKELPYPRAKSQRQVPVNIRVRLAERSGSSGPTFGDRFADNTLRGFGADSERQFDCSLSASPLIPGDERWRHPI